MANRRGVHLQPVRLEQKREHERGGQSTSIETLTIWYHARCGFERLDSFAQAWSRLFVLLLEHGFVWLASA